MELTESQKRRRVLLEIKDLLTGAAFPFMVQLLYSASLILFAGYTADAGIQITALLFGEGLLIGAYVIFGRQNGLTAYRKFAVNSKRRQLNATDVSAYYKTGEYAVWKGIVIALISVVPYMLFQLIQCVAPSKWCGFVLKYAFGWAAYPFVLIGQIPSVGQLSEWLNFIWITVLLGVHAAAYVWGASGEKKRQEAFAETSEKGKKRK